MHVADMSAGRVQRAGPEAYAGVGARGVCRRPEAFAEGRCVAQMAVVWAAGRGVCRQRHVQGAEVCAGKRGLGQVTELACCVAW